MKKFNLRKYVKSNISDLNWMVRDSVTLNGIHMTYINDGNFLYCEIEKSLIIYDIAKKTLYITNGASEGINSRYLDKLYEVKLWDVWDFFLINKLKRVNKDILKKRKEKEEVEKMERLPKSILREYKIDNILEEQ